MKKPLHLDHQEWVDPLGRTLTVCILHELEEVSTEIYQAIAVVGGLSVCREHMQITAALMVHQYDILEIMSLAYEGRLMDIYNSASSIKELPTDEQGLQNQEAQERSGGEGASQGADSASANPSVDDRSGHNPGPVSSGVVPAPHAEAVPGDVRFESGTVDAGADQLP